MASTLFSLAAHAGNCRLVRAVWPHLAPSELSNHDAVQAFHSAAVRSDSDMIATCARDCTAHDLSDARECRGVVWSHVGAIDMLLRHARVHADRETERALVETALWRTRVAPSKVAVVEFLIVSATAPSARKCTWRQVIAGGSRRMRRNEVELLHVSIIETMLAHVGALSQRDLITHGPTLLARCIEMGPQAHSFACSRTRRACVRA
jgi:hypothetical protein